MTDWFNLLLLSPRSPLQDPKKSKNSDINYDLASIKHLYIFAWMVEKSFTSGTDQVQDLQSPEIFQKIGGNIKNDLIPKMKQ